MNKNKRFRSALLGFNKKDVNLYIEKLVKDFEEKLKQSEYQIIFLKNKIDTLEYKATQFNNSSNEMDKSKIADVLIKAQEQSEEMIKDTESLIESEIKKLELIKCEEHQKISNLKNELQYLKELIKEILIKHLGDIDNVLKLWYKFWNGIYFNKKRR